jgi:beta-lactamase superfamily II metal-dependent hydrolase
MLREPQSSKRLKVRRSKANPTGKNFARIRMYNVGFGDCFLIFVPTSAGEKKVLIDCGSIRASTNSVKSIVGELISDITAGDGVPRIDLLIATHRHKDHIIGFADPRWRQVSVGEVWMPWIENPRNIRAREIRFAQTAFIKALDRAFQARAALRKTSAYELVLNARSNQEALDILHGGFSGNPTRRYLPRREDFEVVKTDMLPGVRIFVLGPSHDEEVRKWMEPAKPGDAYLTALEAEADGEDGDTVTFDFGQNWAIRDDHIEHVGGGIFPKSLVLDASDIAKVRNHAKGQNWELLAARADEAINNTSLILVFQIESAYLFFPGDAQWGPWQHILGNREMRELIARSTFYKVSHHGSRNATPPGFVAALTENPDRGRTAMLSVAQHMWDDIPRKQLIAELESVTSRLVRSDVPGTQLGLDRKDNLWVELKVPL